MTRLLPLLVGAAAVAAAAVDSGRQTGRWGDAEDVGIAGARLSRVPADLGGWRSKPLELDPRQMKVAGFSDYVSRTYANPATGERLQVLLICGRPGPVSVHTPDACYPSAGYDAEGALQKVKLGADEFVSAKFVRPPPAPDALRIFWAWSTGGRWQAPDNPRRAYGRSTGALYKLYVIRHAGPADGADDPAVAFLGLLLPELKRCLAPTP